MTIVLKPVHLVLIAFVAGIALAGGIALALSGGDGNTPTSEVLSATQSVGVDIAPTNAPTPTTVPAPTATTAPAVVVQATPEPIIRSCDEIRAAGDYLNSEERTFFLANCTMDTTASSGGGATQSGVTSPPPTQAAAQTGPTEEERAYRSRAQALLADQIARLTQYWGTPSDGVIGDILTLGSVAGNLGNQLAALEPPPARFAQAHRQLRAALSDFSSWMQSVNNVHTQAEAVAFVNGWDLRAMNVAAAWDDYILVVGLNLPSLR